MIDPNGTPHPRPSEEGLRHLFGEVLLAEDWDARFSANAAGMRAIGAELAYATEPHEVLKFTEMRGEALIRTLGSGTIFLFKRDVLAERDAFESQFGDSE
jgi:hypothetical protein